MVFNTRDQVPIDAGIDLYTKASIHEENNTMVVVSW